MAAALFKKLVSQREDAGEWRVESAGVWARDGNPAALLSQVVMGEKGLDISAHQSQLADCPLLQNFDLILTMEAEQKYVLQMRCEEYSNRVYMLSEMVGDEFDIPDPIGGESADYEEIASLIERLLTDGFDKIHELAFLQQTAE